jgi:hypothetical protein
MHRRQWRRRCKSPKVTEKTYRSRSALSGSGSPELQWLISHISHSPASDFCLRCTAALHEDAGYRELDHLFGWTFVSH